MNHRFIMTTLMCVVVMQASGQRTTPPAEAFPKRSVILMGGWSWPLSRAGLTEYWQPGPAGYLEFATRVSRSFSLGLGLEASAYWFNGPKFAQNHPTVASENPPVAQISPSLVGRFDLTPTKRLAPYLGASVGVARLTGATYQQVVDSVLVTYYSIPGRWRLAGGLLCGVEYRADRRFALAAEARALYVIHDDNVGWTVTVRAGFKFSF